MPESHLKIDEYLIKWKKNGGLLLEDGLRKEK